FLLLFLLIASAPEHAAKASERALEGATDRRPLLARGRSVRRGLTVRTAHAQRKAGLDRIALDVLHLHGDFLPDALVAAEPGFGALGDVPGATRSQSELFRVGPLEAKRLVRFLEFRCNPLVEREGELADLRCLRVAAALRAGDDDLLGLVAGDRLTLARALH